MCRLCKENIIADRKISKSVKKLVHKIEQKYRPETILLYGSLARGDFHEGSDLDMIVVADFKEHFFDRIGGLLELNKTAMDFEPLAYTPLEFRRMIKEGRPLIRTALREGVVV